MKRVLNFYDMIKCQNRDKNKKRKCGFIFNYFPRNIKYESLKSLRISIFHLHPDHMFIIGKFISYINI